MKVIGFNLTRMHAEKLVDRLSQKPVTSIEFTDLQKDKAELLKEGEVMKLTFQYIVTYGDSEKKKSVEGEVNFEGNIVLSVTEEESKDISKEWKKKKLPSVINLILFNLILKKCTPKAVFLEDETGLPAHIPMPRIQPKIPEENK